MNYVLWLHLEEKVPRRTFARMRAGGSEKWDGESSERRKLWQNPWVKGDVVYVPYTVPAFSAIAEDVEEYGRSHGLAGSEDGLSARQSVEELVPHIITRDVGRGQPDLSTFNVYLPYLMLLQVANHGTYTYTIIPTAITYLARITCTYYLAMTRTLPNHYSYLTRPLLVHYLTITHTWPLPYAVGRCRTARHQTLLAVGLQVSVLGLAVVSKPAPAGAGGWAEVNKGGVTGTLGDELAAVEAIEGRVWEVEVAEGEEGEARTYSVPTSLSVTVDLCAERDLGGIIGGGCHCQGAEMLHRYPSRPSRELHHPRASPRVVQRVRGADARGAVRPRPPPSARRAGATQPCPAEGCNAYHASRTLEARRVEYESERKLFDSLVKAAVDSTAGHNALLARVLAHAHKHRQVRWLDKGIPMFNA